MVSRTDTMFIFKTSVYHHAPTICLEWNFAKSFLLGLDFMLL